MKFSIIHPKKPIEYDENRNAIASDYIIAKIENHFKEVETVEVPVHKPYLISDDSCNGSLYNIAIYKKFSAYDPDTGVCVFKFKEIIK